MKPRFLITAVLILRVAFSPGAMLGSGVGQDSGINETLARIKQYRLYQDRQPLRDVESLVYRAQTDTGLRAELVSELSKLLPDRSCSMDARKFICTQLGVLGDDGAVPALSRALGHPGLSLQARGALVKIGTRDAVQAMRRGLEDARGALRAALLASLADCGDEQVIPIAASLAKSAEAITASAAIRAMGQLGGGDARRALWQMRSGIPASCEREWADAALMCCERMRSTADRAEISRWLGELQKEHWPGHVRGAALELFLMSGAVGDPARMWSFLKSLDRRQMLGVFHSRRAGLDVARILKAGWNQAATAEEKKAVLILLPECPDSGLLHLAREALEQEELAGEAAQAVLGICEKGHQFHLPAEECRKALSGVMRVSVQESIKLQAVACWIRLEGAENIASRAVADSPDGHEPDHGGQDAHAAIDNNPATYWDEVNDQQEYQIRLTFPCPVPMRAISLSGYEHHSYAPRDFDILADGKVIQSVKDAQYQRNQLIVAVPAGNRRVLELKITGYYGASPAIRELQVFAKAPPLESPPPGFSWKKSEGSVSLLNQGITVWRFQYGRELHLPYFHPLALADGTVLSWNSPPDHVWHHGLWFSWKFINGINYWETRRDDKSDGRTRVAGCKIETRPDFSCYITMELEYFPARKPDAPVVLKESRLIEISRPVAPEGYRLDWTQVFTAGKEPVELTRTPIPGEPGGVGHGGYAGLSMRFAKEFNDWQLVTSTGLQDMKAHGKKAMACDFSGRVGGRQAGLAFLDDPSNINSPTPWFVVMTSRIPFAYFSPACIFHGPHRIEPGKSLRLRYRVLVHEGCWSPGRLLQELNRFSRK